MTFHFCHFNSTLIYVLIDIYYSYQFIGLYLATIISTLASIIFLSSSNSAKTIGKWLVAGGAFEAGSLIVSAGLMQLKKVLSLLQMLIHLVEVIVVILQIAVRIQLGILERILVEVIGVQRTVQRILGLHHLSHHLREGIQAEVRVENNSIFILSELNELSIEL